MATSTTIPGFVPVDSPTYTTPVQVTGHTVNNLTVARTPLGKAVFGWSSGGKYYCAVRDDFEDVYRDDVVPDGDERVVLGGAGTSVELGSIWVDPREGLFCALKWQNGNIGASVCYKADDVENPISWVERGTIISATASGTIVTVDSGGPVTILDSGRWVLPFPGWHPYATGKADYSMLAISDDRGIDWTVKILHRQGALFSGTTGPIGNTIGQDPLTGYLYWSHYWGPVSNQGFVYESQDDGTTWVQVQGDASRAWHFCIDDNASKLYVVGSTAASEWEFSEAVTPSDDTSFTDLNLTAIPSRQAAQFQCHVFLEHGSVAFVDTNRIAGQFFEAACERPDPLHIPYKDRLLNLDLDPDNRPIRASYVEMASHDFDNLKTIERWAGRWMDVAGSANGCRLFIPYKMHLNHTGQLSPRVLRVIADQAFDNYKTIERWALSITAGECSCVAPDRCRLHIPFKDAEAGVDISEDGALDPDALARAAQRDFDNYKVIERWANAYARGNCSTSNVTFPFTPFPPDPVVAGRISGQMLESSTNEASASRVSGQMLESSTNQASDSRVTGQILESSTNEASSARIAGQILEVAVTV